jgi:hypothetical protein
VALLGHQNTVVVQEFIGVRLRKHLIVNSISIFSNVWEVEHPLVHLVRVMLIYLSNAIFFLPERRIVLMENTVILTRCLDVRKR